jgi:hypothetical protein
VLVLQPAPSIANLRVIPPACRSRPFDVSRMQFNGDGEARSYFGGIDVLAFDHVNGRI